MKRLACAVLVLASGCSLLFDPSQVPVGDSGTGDGGCSCASLPNTSVTCSGAGCSYSCTGAFRDIDGDLADGGATGCELDCAGAVAATNPTGLVATVGNPQGVTAGGALELKWPESTPPTQGYFICIGPNTADCFVAPAAAICDGGVCTLLTPGGLPVNNRISATVRGANVCTGPGADPAPLVRFTPLDPLLATAYDLDTYPATGCAPGLSVPSIGELQVVNQNGCLSKLKLGDENWGDLTVQVDTFVNSTATAPDQAGVGVQGTTNGHVAAAGFLYKDVDRATAVAYWPPQSFYPLYGASSVFASPTNQWVTLRLVVSGEWFSLSTGAAGAPLVERIRWPSPEPDAGTMLGKAGIYASGAGTVRFRNFTLSTASTLPPRGPTSVNYSMNDAGTALPASWKIRPMPGAAVAQWAACPPFPEAAGCDAGACGPGARGCARIERTSAFISPPEGSVFFDIPSGIDVTRSWSYSFRLAATDGGAQNAIFAGIPTNNLLQPGDLLRAPGNNFNQPLESGPQVLPASLQANRWNHVRFQFEPDAGTIGVQLNGSAPTSYARPSGWDRHTGAIQMGAGADLEMFITDINISQP